MPADQFPNRIREHRRRADLTLQELGRRVGLTKAAVSHLERGERPVTVDRLRSIARALSEDLPIAISVGDLLSLDDNPAAPRSGDERRFLDSYRHLNLRAQRAVRNLVNDLAE